MKTPYKMSDSELIQLEIDRMAKILEERRGGNKMMVDVYRNSMKVVFKKPS